MTAKPPLDTPKGLEEAALIAPLGDPEMTRDYHLKEYEMLTGQIQFYLEENERAERFALLGMVAIYAFLLSKDYDNFAYLSAAFWLAPCVLAFYAMRKFDGYRKKIYTAATYLTCIQARFADEVLEGWETHLRRRAETQARATRMLFNRQMVAWKTGFGITVAIAALVMAETFVPGLVSGVGPAAPSP